MNRKSSTTISLIAALFSLVACGSGGGKSPTATKDGDTYTADEFPVLYPGLDAFVACYVVYAGYTQRYSTNCSATSADPGIAKIGSSSNTATVVGVSPGKTTVTIVLSGGGPTLTRQVTVIPYDPEMVPASATRAVGETVDFEFQLQRLDGSATGIAHTNSDKIDWTIDDPSVAQFTNSQQSEKRTIRALRSGTARVTAKYTGIGGPSTVVGTLVVTGSAVTVKSDSAHVTVQGGQTIGVPISIKNAQGQTVQNPTVTVAPVPPGNCFTATATPTAIVVTGATAGNCTMRITATDPATGATATLDLQVTTTAGPPQVAVLVGAGTGTPVGSTRQLSAITPDGTLVQFTAASSAIASPAMMPLANQTSVGFTSSNTAVATVSSAGLVTAVGAGTAGISGTWTLNGTNYTANFSQLVGPLDNTTPQSISLSTMSGLSNSVRVGKVTAYLCTASNSGTAVVANTVWTSSNTAVATVNSSGVVTGVSAGSATITCNVNSRTTTMPTTVTP